MEPQIKVIRFGMVKAGGKTVKHDILIGLDGEVRKRKKRLSKEVYGTSHTISLAEARAILEEGADTLIIGTGHFDRVRLSREAEEYLAKEHCAVEMLPTRKAAKHWNRSKGNVIGVFHITC
ncbi:MAG: hypothetical protein H8D77_00550 [Chloroflexi bacterium]|jgi:hypothetical protein|nr:hypothetical protein [Chloroflexota bacterium]MBL7201434.1 hypothetical protein [Anaerolineae bacterium]